MAKTSLDPTLVNQLRKLFPEVAMESGNVSLVGGIATISLSRRYDGFKVSIVQISDSPDATKAYSIIKNWNNKFQIKSSDVADTATFDWIVVGG